MTNYLETLKSVLSFFQGLTIEITYDNISNFSEIANSINYVPLQKVTNMFNNVQTQYKKIREMIKIESSLSKINENNVEKTKFQIIQSFLTKEPKYHNLLIDILLYYSKIRPMKIKFYIQLIESLIQKNSNNRRMTSSSQLSNKNLTTTLNNKRIIKPQINRTKARQKSLSSTLQITLNKTENFETNQFSNILLKELKNPLIRPFFNNYFIFRIFSNSIITTKKQKLTILNFVKESNSEELKEWFSSSLKTLTKEQLELYNKYTTYLNEEQIRESIRNDNLNEIKSILNLNNKQSIEYKEKMTLNSKTVFDFFNIKKNKPFYLTEYAALCSSINSFKYFLSVNFKLPSNILKKAIKGGEIEIIELCIEKGFKLNNSQYDQLLNTSIKYHQNKIFKWFTNSNPFKLKNPLISIQTYNFKTFLQTEFVNFDFIFELINYNNILLIELISPYLHSFVKLIMAYYSIINHSNEIATFLYDSIDEIRYPLIYLTQLKNIQNENDIFNSIIESSKQEKFEKEIIFSLFCFVNDNVDFLKFLLTNNINGQNIAFKSLCCGCFLFNDLKLSSCQKFIFSFISGFVNEEKVFSLFIENEENLTSNFLLLNLFENLKLKFNQIQLNFIVYNLLKRKNCRPIIFRNHNNLISTELLIKLIENNEDIFDELISYDNIDINVVLKLYLNKISMKFRPDSREKMNNSNLLVTATTARRISTSFNERENEKKIINSCSSHSLFNINYEVDDDKNSYLHLIVMNDLDYILRFILTNPIYRQILNKCNKFNKTPLLMAIEYSNIECIQILIEQNGINTSIFDTCEMNALNYAIQNNLLNFVSKIIENKNKKIKSKTAKIENNTDSINLISKIHHISPICCSRSIEMVNLLLSQGAQKSTFNCVDKEGKTLLVKSLDFLSKSGNSFDYKFLFNNLNGIDINSQCEDGKTFLMRSIELNQYNSIIEYLDQNSIQKADQKKQQKSTKTKNSLKTSKDEKEEEEVPYFIDYSIMSKENSYLASSIKSNNFELIEKFLSISMKNGNDQAALIESMKQKGSNFSSIATKLISSFKKKIELTPHQVVEDLQQIQEKYFEFILKQEKDPHKTFNLIYNDKNILISSIMNNNNSLFKFLISNNNSINFDFNWCNSNGLNCFDFAIQFENKEITEILFNQTKINKSIDSFRKILIKKNKFSCSLKLDQSIKNKWISDVLFKERDRLFIELIESNNVELFNLIINDIDNEYLINKALKIAVSKRFDSILNGLLNHKLLNVELALKLAADQNNTALFKSLIVKYNQSVNMNKFVEIVLYSNQSIKSVYSSYANISDHTKKLLKNEDDFIFGVQDVNDLIKFAK